MTITKTNILIGILLAIAFAVIAPTMFSVGNAHASIYSGTVLSTATTSTAVAVTSSVRVLATTTSASNPSYTRVYATICNANANPVFLNMNSDRAATLTSATYVIAAAAGYSACYEITDRNMYQGSITASSTNQTSTTVQVTDYVQ